MSKLKIIPTQLSDEELLAAFEGSEDVEIEEEEVLEHTDDIVPFLSHYNITPGNLLVSKKLLYKLYKTYSKDPQTEVNFNRTVGTFLGHYRNYSGNFYLINKDNFRISKHIFEETIKHQVRKTHSQTYQKHFVWFMKNSGVARGEIWLEGFILFHVYKDYCRTKGLSAKLGYENFHKFLKLNFEHKRIDKNRSLWFKVNEETFNIMSEEEKNAIREGRKKRRSKESGKAREEKT